MIPRILVPRDLRFPAEDPAAKKPSRTTSLLDSRIVVPGNLPVAPIDPKSRIPSHVPLDVLSTRTLVPRDLPAKPIVDLRAIPDFVPLTILDSRVVVPAGVEPAELEPRAELPLGMFEGVVEPDVITTGEVNLLNKPVEDRGSDWNQIARLGSLVLHIALVVFVLFSPKLFPPRAPTQEEVDLARKQLSFVYLPPSVEDVPKIAPQLQPPSAKMRIDPWILRKVAPPELEPSPMPGPPAQPAPSVQPNLPAAPTPQFSRPQGQSGQRRDNSPQVPRIENVPAAPAPSNSLVLPHLSPGRALQESLQDALKANGGPGGGFADPMPQSPGGGSGGGGQGYLGGNLEMLTPTEGVDFSNYLARLLASVKRNWYAVIPESAKLGEKGRVILQFRISRDGSVPLPEPVLVRTSGKEPLDHAAMSAIRASSPFEPLPPAFSGPYIELRFIFLYNLPLNYQ
jgi:TonB family protein